MSKFKVKDKARVTGAKYFHGFPVGEIVTIIKVRHDGKSVVATGGVLPRVVLERTKQFLGEEVSAFHLKTYKENEVDLDKPILLEQMLLLDDIEPVDVVEDNKDLEELI